MEPLNVCGVDEVAARRFTPQARMVTNTADFAAVFRYFVFILPYLTEQEFVKLDAGVNRE